MDLFLAIAGLRLGTSPNAGNSSNLGSIESPLSIGSSFQGGLTVNNLQQMQQVQMHGGLGGSLGSTQLGAASASNISSLLKADQGGQTSSVPSLSGLGLGNGMQGSNLGGLSGYGMAGSLSGNSGLVGQQGAMTFGSPNQVRLNDRRFFCCMIVIFLDHHLCLMIPWTGFQQLIALLAL